METHISHELYEEYLRVTLTGKFPVREARDLILKMRELSDMHRKTKIMVDSLNIDAPVSAIHRYSIGILIAEIFDGNHKIAVLFNPMLINAFTEDVANNRGVYMKVMGDESQALAWLLGRS